jgi:hypothetical protein
MNLVVEVDDTARDMEVVALFEGSQQLDHEERVPGRRDQAIAQPRPRRGPGARRDERGDGLRVERLEHVVFSSRVLEDGRELAQRVGSTCGSERDDERGGDRGDPGREMHQGAEAQVVGPVQVLGDEQERLLLCRVLDERGELLQVAVTAAARRSWQLRRRREQGRECCDQRLGQVAGPVMSQLVRCGPADSSAHRRGALRRLRREM